MTSTDLKGIMLSEISWTGKDKYSMISHMKSKKTKITIEKRGQICGYQRWR